MLRPLQPSHPNHLRVVDKKTKLLSISSRLTSISCQPSWLWYHCHDDHPQPTHSRLHCFNRHVGHVTGHWHLPWFDRHPPDHNGRLPVWQPEDGVTSGGGFHVGDVHVNFDVDGGSHGSLCLWSSVLDGDLGRLHRDRPSLLCLLTGVLSTENNER